ncbi:hypothetical protein PINS_up005869 [Pythium insidiosum]|nr:hypothetical protein PINS_up005869 [Pythium insidiosum]
MCDTLPGLETYDRRPQYNVKRHQVTTGLSASVKQYKKKKLKYNCKLDDKIDDCKAEAEAGIACGEDEQDLDLEQEDDSRTGYTADDRFQFSATLRLPVMLGIKKSLSSPKVASDEEAKAIVAFKACQELLRRGILDRRFKSRLLEETKSTIHSTSGTVEEPSRQPNVDDSTHGHVATSKLTIDEPNYAPTTKSTAPEKLKDMVTQDSYDLPPVGAAELGLKTVRSVAGNEAEYDPETGTVSMYFYGIKGLRFAILATDKLYTGNTNTGWRYDFATSEVMEPVVRSVTLQNDPNVLKLSKTQVQNALHFHLIAMRLACMTVNDALREVCVQGDEVWKEFSDQNDKGYLVVPSKLSDSTLAGGSDIIPDWEYLEEIITKPLLLDCWPFPQNEDIPQDEWVCVPKARRNVTYIVKSVTELPAKELLRSLIDDDNAWAAHMKNSKSTAGVPRFGRWHSREQLMEADAEQPLLHGVQVPTIVPIMRRVMQRNHDEATIAQSKTKFNERLFLPQHTTLLRITKTRFFEVMGIVPLLYEFERKCQMSHLMMKIGMEIDLKLLDDSTTKPAYERNEILGDTYLKLETSWYMYEQRKDIVEEGFLTQLRRDIIRNDRLNHFALQAGLQHYIVYPAVIEQHPFRWWKPSCMGKAPEPVVAPSKWIADVLEAICGAFLIGQGEAGARYFLRWIGVSVPNETHVLCRPFYPDSFPCELYVDHDCQAEASRRDIGFSVDRFDNLSDRLATLQERLKYTFRNKLLLLEAITHPSVGAFQIAFAGSHERPTLWRNNYERLEYLGDAVIEYLTLSYAFVRYESWLPGSLTQWKSATVSNDALGKTALAYFGIDECMLIGSIKIDRESLSVVSAIERQYIRKNTPSGLLVGLQHHVPAPTARPKTKEAVGPNMLSLPKMFADVFEALVAAVFLDSGHDLQVVRDVFMGPLMATVSHDAFVYVCRESGLPIGDETDEGDALMLLSDDDD